MNKQKEVEYMVFSPVEMLKAKRGNAAAPRRWADGKLHKKVGGKWVVVSEGGKAAALSDREKKYADKITKVLKRIDDAKSKGVDAANLRWGVDNLLSELSSEERTRVVAHIKGKRGSSGKSKPKKPTQIQKEKAAAKPSMRSLNDYIKSTYGGDITMYKGSGYFYYMGGDSTIPSTYVNALNAWDMEGWKGEIDAQMKDAGIPKLSAGQKMQRAANVVLGNNLPGVSSYDEVPEPAKMTAKERSKLNAALNAALPGNYYEDIPMEDIRSELQKEGYVLIQEDGTNWSGMLLGDDAHALFEIGRLSDGRTLNGLATYKPISNTGLMLAWYKMQSGKVEITKYIG